MAGVGGVDPTHSIGASMYHSAVESLFGRDHEEMAEAKGKVSSEEPVEEAGQGKTGRKRLLSSTSLAQRLLVASEKQISAKLSITEILLSLSSQGVCVCVCVVVVVVCVCVH